MRIRENDTDPVPVLRLVAALWLGYLLLLLGIDHLILPSPLFKSPYYFINSSVMLVVLGIVSWSRSRNLLGSWLLPLGIALLAVSPIISANLPMLRMPCQPAVKMEVVMRNTPLLVIPLILTAWRYRWPQVALLTLTVVVVRSVMQLLFPLYGPLPLSTFVIWFVSYLLAGCFSCKLITRLREQKVSLEEAHSQLMHYASTLEHLTISRERNRLARELHDTLAHTLTGLSVQLEAAKAYFHVDAKATEELIDKALETTRSGVVETRLALKSLRAGPLDDLGLLQALRKLAGDAAARAGLELHLFLPDQIDTLSPDVEQAVYRVAQEALANVVKHAGARTLTMQLSVHEGRLELIVRDDGKGFDLHNYQSAGFGVAGIHERAELAGGSLTVETGTGQGTAITLTI